MGQKVEGKFSVEAPKYLFLAFVSFFVFFPLYLMVNISLKNSSQIAKNMWFPEAAVEIIKIETPVAGTITYGQARLAVTGADGSREYDITLEPGLVLDYNRDGDLRVPERVEKGALLATIRLAEDMQLYTDADGMLHRVSGKALVLPAGFAVLLETGGEAGRKSTGTIVGELRAPFAGTLARYGADYSFINAETGAAEPLVTRYGQRQQSIPANAAVQAASGTVLPAGALVYTYKRRTVFKWENYIEAYKYVLPYVANTLLIAVSVVVLSLLLSSLSAYAFSRYDFYGKNVLFSMIVVLMMIPGVLNLVPMFVIVKNFPLFGGNDLFGNGGYGLLDNPLVVILPAVAGSQIMNIYILRNFFEGLPEGLFESGRIDGATDLQMYWHICLPLSRPIMGTLAIMAIVAQWNNYLWPLVTLKKESLFTITIGLAHLEGQFASDYGLQMAGFTIAAVPLVLLFIFTMKLFIRGLSSGAIKF